MNTSHYQHAQGPQAIRHQLSQAFKQAKPDTVVYGICNLDLVKAHFPEMELVSANPTRSEAELPSRFIYTSTSGPELRSTDQMYRRESRFISDDFSLNFTVVGNWVIFVTLEGDEVVSHSIKSAGLANDMMNMFNIIWERSEV